MPYKCAKCDTVQSRKTDFYGNCQDGEKHNLKALHGHNHIGHTKECPHCEELKNGVMERQVGKVEIEACADCADIERGKGSQPRGTERPKQPDGYNRHNPEPNKVYVAGKKGEITEIRTKFMNENAQFKLSWIDGKSQYEIYNFALFLNRHEAIGKKVLLENESQIKHISLKKL